MEFLSSYQLYDELVDDKTEDHSNKNRQYRKVGYIILGLG